MIGLLRLSGGLERKLFAHGGRRVADCLHRVCKLLLRYAKMSGPNPDLIFAVKENLVAIAGYACVRFHALFLWIAMSFCRAPATALKLPSSDFPPPGLARQHRSRAPFPMHDEIAHYFD
jgi:hypothetical protein